MKTMKRVSLGAILCSVVAIALLSACGGGAGVWHEPNHNGNENKEDKSSTSIEQILTIKADRPVSLSYSGFGFYNTYVNGVKKDNSFSGSLDLKAHTETAIRFKVTPNSYNKEALQLKVRFMIQAIEQYEKNPSLENQPDPTKPIPTVVTFTWQEKVNDKTTREENETIKLYDPLRDPNSKWEYSSKEYESKG